MENNNKGLGDVVEEIIENTIPKIAKTVKKRGCNCNRRKRWLNNIGAKFS